MSVCKLNQSKTAQPRENVIRVIHLVFWLENKAIFSSFWKKNLWSQSSYWMLIQEPRYLKNKCAKKKKQINKQSDEPTKKKKKKLSKSKTTTKNQIKTNILLLTETLAGYEARSIFKGSTVELRVYFIHDRLLSQSKITQPALLFTHS